MMWTRREFMCRTALGASWCACAAAELPPPKDIAQWSRVVGALLATTPHNRIPGTELRVYGAPLFAVSAAQDPLYRKLKQAVGPDHFMPEDLFRGARTVISYFLPYTEAVSRANYGKDDKPALWIQAHHQGAMAAELVRRFITKNLTDLNARVFIPFHDSRYKTGTLVSNWSERHIAYVSGLGTFGLHKNIITAAGTSGRLDSMLTDYAFTPTPRKYAGVYDHCIKCFACVRRCPVGAIKETGKDIRVCAIKVLAGKNSPEKAVCGKCLTDVSCERCNPRQADAETAPKPARRAQAV